MFLFCDFFPCLFFHFLFIVYLVYDFIINIYGEIQLFETEIVSLCLCVLFLPREINRCVTHGIVRQGSP